MKIGKVEEYLKIEKVTDFTKNGECSKCGNCCGKYLPLTTYEIDRIKAYIKKHNIKEHINNFAYGLDMTCPFLNDKQMCNIYKVRPQICRCFKCDKTQSEVIGTYGPFNHKSLPCRFKKNFFREVRENV